MLIVGACSENPGLTEANKGITPVQNAAASSVNSQAAIDLVATSHHNHQTNEHSFELSTQEVDEGWTTIQFDNASHSDHFVLIYKVPQEAIDAAESANESILDLWYNGVTVPFQEEFNPYIAGNIDWDAFYSSLGNRIGAEALWYFSPGAPTMGGPGITSAGHSSTTTVNLESGVYVVECYVKDENQEFHSYNGMLELLTVNEGNRDENEPKSTMDISITQGGLEIPENIKPGQHTIGITFGEQPPYGYEHLLGHNAQLVRFDDGYNQSLLDELGVWMDWTKVNGLVHRAPEGVTFLGGSMEMPGGHTSYHSVLLKPGDYAWIAEVPNPAGKNMLKTFTIPSRKSMGAASLSIHN